MSRHSHPKSEGRAAFLFTLEAASSLFLLLTAAGVAAAFNSHHAGEQEFMLCNDAAGVIAKAASRQADMQKTAEELLELSGLCIGIEGSYSASTCAMSSAQNKIVFSIPVYAQGQPSSIGIARVSCYPKGS